MVRVVVQMGTKGMEQEEDRVVVDRVVEDQEGAMVQAEAAAAVNPREGEETTMMMVPDFP
jgi:hypothetical protein